MPPARRTSASSSTNTVPTITRRSSATFRSARCPTGLEQPSFMRDAILAARVLHVFMRHADRVDYGEPVDVDSTSCTPRLRPKDRR